MHLLSVQKTVGERQPCASPERKFAHLQVVTVVNLVENPERRRRWADRPQQKIRVLPEKWCLDDYSSIPGERNCEIETAVWIYVGNRSLLP